jgi:hypothetical protein
MTKFQPKRSSGLEIQTFKGKSGNLYMVFQTVGSYHVLVETDAKKAAVDCGAPDEGNTRKRWLSLWKTHEA